MSDLDEVGACILQADPNSLSRVCELRGKTERHLDLGRPSDCYQPCRGVIRRHLFGPEKLKLDSHGRLPPRIGRSGSMSCSRLTELFVARRRSHSMISGSHQKFRPLPNFTISPALESRPQDRSL